VQQPVRSRSPSEKRREESDESDGARFLPALAKNDRIELAPTISDIAVAMRSQVDSSVAVRAGPNHSAARA
jgi:hypothetical protein